MADCLSNLSGIRKIPCGEALGGYKYILLSPFQEGLEFTMGTGSVANYITSIPNDITGVYKYELVPGASTNTFTQEGADSAENGVTPKTLTVVVSLPRIDADTSAHLGLLSNQRLYVFLVDNMGNMLLIGRENGAWKTADTLTTGAAYADYQGFTVTFTATERYNAGFLSPAAQAQVLALLPPEV